MPRTTTTTTTNMGKVMGIGDFGVTHVWFQYYEKENILFYFQLLQTPTPPPPLPMVGNLNPRNNPACFCFENSIDHLETPLAIPL